MKRSLLIVCVCVLGLTLLAGCTVKRTNLGEWEFAVMEVVPEEGFCSTVQTTGIGFELEFKTGGNILSTLFSSGFNIFSLMPASVKMGYFKYTKLQAPVLKDQERMANILIDTGFSLLKNGITDTVATGEVPGQMYKEEKEEPER